MWKKAHKLYVQAFQEPATDAEKKRLAKLLKKPHQASAVNLASHLWWQEVPPEEESAEAEKDSEKKNGTKEEGEKKAVSLGIQYAVHFRSKLTMHASVSSAR